MRSPLLLALVCFASAVVPAMGQTLSAAEAKNHIGETATVCGKIAGKITAEGNEGARTFISLDSAYPHQAFTIVIWEEDQKEIGPIPPQGSRICATGKLTIWRGVPQIVARFSWQLSQ